MKCTQSCNINIQLEKCIMIRRKQVCESENETVKRNKIMLNKLSMSKKRVLETSDEASI